MAIDKKRDVYYEVVSIRLETSDIQSITKGCVYWWIFQVCYAQIRPLLLAIYENHVTMYVYYGLLDLYLLISITKPTLQNKRYFGYC